MKSHKFQIILEEKCTVVRAYYQAQIVCRWISQGEKNSIRAVCSEYQIWRCILLLTGDFPENNFFVYKDSC